MPYTGPEYEKNLSRLADLSADQVLAMHETVRQAIAKFKGSVEELEAAIGMFYLGHHVGWKPLALIHNKRTIRKYEEILSINIREAFPEEGPSATRSLGYSIVLKLGSFWKAVSGELRDDELKSNRRTLD